MRFSLATLALASMSLGGCAQLQGAVDFIDAPKTQQAIFTLKTVATALVCDVQAGSSLALQIEKAASAHTGVTSEIAVISGSVCTALQGALTGKTVSNVAAVASVSAAP
jgi:hypothetical protein